MKNTRTPRASLYFKRVASNVAIASLFNVCLAWYRDWHMSAVVFFINIATFTLASLITTYLFDTRRLPGVVMATIDKINQTPPKDLARGLVRFTVDYPTLLLGLLIAILWGQAAPSISTLPASVQVVYNVANTVGIIALILSVVWQVVTSMGTPASAVALIVTVVERFILLAACLIVVRAFGPQLADVLVWVKTNPDAALSGVAGIVVVRVMFVFAPPSRSVTSARGSEYAYGVAASAMPRRARRPQDIYRTAAHEAGHLMLFAALPTLPDDLTVNVLPEIGVQDEIVALSDTACNGRMKSLRDIRTGPC